MAYTENIPRAVCSRCGRNEILMPHFSLKFLLVCVVSLLFWTATERAFAAGDAKQFVLVIDAGHGGNDAGAVGAYSKEKDINLKVALEVGRLIKANCPDIKVVYTRDKDVFIPLQRRADIANKAKADLFVSIHTNALPKGRIAYGAETYTLGMARAEANLEVAKRENSVIVYEDNYEQTYEGFDPNKAESYIIFELLQDRYMKQSVELARCIQQQYVNNGRKNKGVHQAGFLVLRKTSMPAVLTELGFISTPAEERYLNSKQGVQELGRSIYNGIVNYRKTYVDNAASSAILKADPIDKAEPEESANQEVAVVPVETSSSAGTKSNAKTETPSKQTSSSTPAQKADADDAGKPVYKVQFLLSSRELKSTDSRLKGYKDATYYKEGSNYKYTYGSTTDYNEILRIQKQVRAKFPDAFVVAFVDGKRISVAEARKLSNQ